MPATRKAPETAFLLLNLLSASNWAGTAATLTRTDLAPSL
jgi:hypothetical protein